MNFKALLLTAAVAVTAIAAPAQADLSGRWNTENTARQTQTDKDKKACYDVAMQLTHSGYNRAFANRGGTIIELSNRGNSTNSECTIKTWTPGQTVDAGSRTFIDGDTVYYQESLKVEGDQIALYRRTYNNNMDNLTRKVVGGVGSETDGKSACFIRAKYSNFYGDNYKMWSFCRVQRGDAY